MPHECLSLTALYGRHDSLQSLARCRDVWFKWHFGDRGMQNSGKLHNCCLKHLWKNNNNSAWIWLCQVYSLRWNSVHVMARMIAPFQRLTPAGTDEHSLTGSWVGDGTVVMDEGGVKGHSIYIQGYWGELDTQGKMMPLTVTHLMERDEVYFTGVNWCLTKNFSILWSLHLHPV